MARANVNWILSIDYDKIPLPIRESGARTYRSLTIDEESFDFSKGFTDLHSRSYQEILNGNGFGMEEVRQTIELVSEIREGRTKT